MRRFVPFVLVVLAGACGRQHDNPNIFSWSREMPVGSTLRVRDMNGTITVVPATDGKTARVVAAAHWRQGNPERDLKFVANVEGADVTVCAHWGTGNCSATEYTNRNRSSSFLHWGSGRKTDATINFTVEVPAGVTVDISSMNGALDVAAQAPVRAHTMNGAIHVATAIGPVNASTMNGDVDVRMTTLGGAGDIRAETTNGSASAYVPQNLDGTVTLRTANGAVVTSFPLSAVGNSKHHLEGVLGAGSRVVNVRTANGTATLGALDALGKIIQASAP